MIMHFNNKLLSKAFFWFGLTLGIFGFVTEVYGQNVYLPADFYIALGSFSMFSSLAARHLD